MALPVTDFVIERLLEYDSSFDTGGGIATTALMVNPLSVILQPLRDELDEIQKNQSILSVLESTDPDAFDEDIVDALASNVFVERGQGNVASGVVRIRFFSPETVDIGTGLASFLSSDNVKFINVNPISITASEMGLNIESALYYVDVPVEADTEGSNGNVLAGGIVSFENEPPNVANVTNIEDFSEGVDRETNTELIDRIKVAVTVRALVTGRGIITTLQDNFDTVLEINPRGFGDPEMQRDIVFNTHIGGNVDVWIKTPSLSEKTYDVVSLVVDTTRRTRERTSFIAFEDYPTKVYDLRHGSIDRTEIAPIVTSADGFVTYIETADYILDDLAGTIGRVTGGAIYRDGGTATGFVDFVDGIASDGKTLCDSSAPWTSVRPGMSLKITAPASVVGTYSIKTVLAGQLVIFGNFPDDTVANVTWEVNDVVSAQYDYNPVAIDVIESARSTSRENYTITETPMMRVKSIETLDPTTLQPTGTFYDSTGGFGQGPFGSGSFGVGTAADYVLKVVYPNLRYSSDENLFIDIVSSKIGDSVRVTYETSPEISVYQTFIDDPLNKVETAILKAKHFIPVFVSTGAGGISYRVKASNTQALTAADIQTLVEKLIEETPIKTDLELSDIVDLLYNSGADRVDLNFVLNGAIHHTDGDVEFISNSAEGLLVIPANLPTDGTLTDTDKPLSQEIAHYISDSIVLNRTTT